MTDEERDALRALQDRWLSLPVVQHQIRNHGEGEHIAGPESPTFADVRQVLLPAWRQWFNAFLWVEANERHNRTSKPSR